jgi:hypothetical protein
MMEVGDFQVTANRYVALAFRVRPQ